MIGWLKKILLHVYVRSKNNNSTIKSYNISKDFRCGDNCIINKRVEIDRNVYIGEYTYLNSNKDWINIESNVTIGKYCSIAPGVKIAFGNHDYKNVTTHPILFDKYYISKIGISTNSQKQNGLKDKDLGTIIGNDVWIGMNANIKRGVKIGNGVVIAGNSVVTHNIPDYAIVVGNPARILKYRFDEKDIDIMNKYKERAWWNWNKEELIDNYDILYDIGKYLDYLKA